MGKKPRALNANMVSTKVWRATNSGLSENLLTLLSEQSGKHKSRVLDIKQRLSPKSSPNCQQGLGRMLLESPIWECEPTEMGR